MGNYIIINRTIKNPIDYNDIVVSGDSNSRVMSFTIERYFDNIDLSTKTINILYVNSLDYAGVGSATVTNVENDFIYFDWTIGRDVLQNAGEVYFAVEFAETNTSVNAIYVWRTKPISLMVESSLITDDAAIPESYLNDISFYNNNRNTITNTMKALSQMRIQNRDIMLSPQLDNIVVEQDSNSQILSFSMDRYYDNIDMSTKLIAINFLNGEGEGGRAVAINVTYDVDNIYFDWLIDSRVTKYGGSISFAIQVTGYENNQFYVWQTIPAAFLIEDGLIVDDPFGIQPLNYTRELEFAHLNSNFDITDLMDEGLPLYVKNRTIELDNQKDIVVKADNFSQLITIRLPRYFDNIDLTKKIITVKYLNADGEGDRTSIVNMYYNDEYINVGWLLDSRFTKTAGDGYFAVEVIGLLSNGDPYIWQTKPTRITIRDGIGSVEGIIPPDPSWLESIYYEISKRADGLIFDEDTNLLQLTAGGHPIGEPVDIFGKNFGDMRKEVFATNSKVNEGYVDKAIKADALMTPRMFSIKGDILSLGVEFDGSNNVELNAVINNSMVAGTYTKVKVNNKGLVVDYATLTEDDIPDLHLSKIVDAGTAAGRDVGLEAGNVVEVNQDGVIDPSLITNGLSPSVFVVTSEASMLALGAKKGDTAIRRDVNTAYILSNNSPSVITSWYELPFDASFTANFSKSFSTNLMDGNLIVRVDSNNHATISVDAADKLSEPFTLDFTNDSDIHTGDIYMIDGSTDVSMKVRTDAVLIRDDFTPTSAVPYPPNPSYGDTYKVLIDWDWGNNVRINAGGFITYTKKNRWEILGSSSSKSYVLQNYISEEDWIYANEYTEYYTYAALIRDTRIKKDDIAQVFYDIDPLLDEAHGLSPFAYTYDGYVKIYCVTPPEFVYVVTLITAVPPKPVIPPQSIRVETPPEISTADTYQLVWQVMPPVAPQDVVFSSPDVPNRILISDGGVVSAVSDVTKIYTITVTCKDYPDIFTTVDVPIYFQPNTIVINTNDNKYNYTVNRTGNELRVMTYPQHSISSCDISIDNSDIISVTSITPPADSFVGETITVKYDTLNEVGQFTARASSNYTTSIFTKTINIHPEPTSIIFKPRTSMVVNDGFVPKDIVDKVMPYTTEHAYNNAIQTITSTILTENTMASKRLISTSSNYYHTATALGQGSIQYWSDENSLVTNTFNINIVPVSTYEMISRAFLNQSTDPKEYIYKLTSWESLPIWIAPVDLLINGEGVFNNNPLLSTISIDSDKVTPATEAYLSFKVTDYVNNVKLRFTNNDQPTFYDEILISVIPYS